MLCYVAQLRLSVSTIGTNELQPLQSSAILYPVCAFSFHNRNERTATGTPKPTPTTKSTFQFPQSERTNCNLLSVRIVFGLISTFSFHNRNERTATLHARVRGGTSPAFQFPQSERTNCNFMRLPNSFNHKYLSVSTIGTNELQLHAAAKFFQS